MAKHNRPNHSPHKRPADPSKPQAGQPSSQPHQQGQRSSGHQGSLNKPEDIQRNATRHPSPGAAATGSEILNNANPKDAPGQRLETDATSPPTSGSAPEPSEASESLYTGPLPDLTRGIPSTLEYETTGRSPLDLTGAEERERPGAAGKGKGELPASAYVTSTEKRRLKFANIMYGVFAGLAVTGTLYLGRNWENEEEERAHPNAPSGWGIGLMWNRSKARVIDETNFYTEPAFTKLLPDVDPMFERPYTLVLSLEDLLIHSEWSREHGWRMAKRPGMDYFLRYLSQYYELVIFTSQPFAIAEPIIRKLDPYHIVTWPLFREATRYENGEYIKVSLQLPLLSIPSTNAPLLGSLISEPRPLKSNSNGHKIRPRQKSA